MLTGVLAVRSIRAAKRRAKTYSQRQSHSLTFYPLIIMLAAVSCRCRASFLRYQHRAAFVTNAAAKKHAAFSRNASDRVSLLSSLARMEPNDDMEETFSGPRRRQSLPPPRARKMPPTLESNDDGMSISPAFPDLDVTSSEFDEYNYDPNVDNSLSYGFYTDLEEKPDPIGSSPAVSSFSVNGQFIKDTDTSELEWDEESDEDNDDTEPYPMEDAYMHSQEAVDVPNPHNYWEEDDDTTVLNDSPPTNADESEATVQAAATATDNVSTRALKKDTNMYSPPPPPSMPPRAVFASQPPDTRQDVYIQGSSGDPITSQVDMLTTQLQELEKKIYKQNNNKEFNIKSTKQVSQVLFGQPGQSTNKETLEAMGGAGNVMADLILQYRTLSRKITRLGKKQENKDNGTHVKNVSASTRPKQNESKSRETDENDNGVVEGDPLLLVDASAYIFRAYYSMPPLHRKDGMPVGAVLGFCNMLNRLVLTRMLNGECPRLVLVFDAKGKTFRHDMYEEYKANRPECPMDLIPQFDLIRQAAEAYGIQQLEAPNFEADDVIATLATMALNEGVDTNILSGDKDLMQLITPQDEFPSIQMVDPMTMSRISHDVVVSKWGVTPDKLGDVLALAGDSADNIPGVPGIGPKIAATLIEEYGSLEDLLDQLDNVKQKKRREKLKDNVEYARLSRQLVELERDLPVDKMTFPDNITGASELRMAPMDGDRLLAFYEEMGLRDMKRRVEARLNQRKPARASNGKTNNRRQKAEIPTPDDYKDVPF